MKSIGLRNIKAYENTGCISIAPITIFVGKNSCGKSSFIRFPVVLAQTFDSGSKTPISLHGQQENYIDYGNFEDVVHNHNGNSFTVELEYPISLDAFSDDMPIIPGPASFYRVGAQLPDTAKIAITYSKPSKNLRVYATKIELYINDEFFSSFDLKKEPKTYVFNQKKTIKNSILVDADYCFELEARSTRNFMPEFEVSDYWPVLCCQFLGVNEEKEQIQLHRELVFPQKRRYIHSIIDKEEKIIEEERSLPSEKKALLEAYYAFEISATLFRIVYNCMRDDYDFSTSLHYIGPFRAAPNRVYRREEVDISDVGKKGDYTSSLLINDDQLKQQVSGWFEKTMGYSLDIQEVGKDTGYYQLFARDENGNDSNIMDVGYGISQVLPIVTQIIKAKQNSDKVKVSKKRNKIAFPETIVIEQPELHLHPAAQSELAALFASAVTNPAAKNRKILIETHSEHFIRALQVLIADPDKRLTKDMVKIYYVDKGENGNSIIKEMKMNDFGQFEEPWPSGFFDRAYDLSMELLEAGARRKSNNKEGEQGDKV